MGITLRVSNNAKQVAQFYRAVPSTQRQIQTAALTTLARRAQKNIEATLPRDISKPNPFTQRAIGSRAASSRFLVSEVFVKRKQAEYLWRLAEPGSKIRRPNVTAIFVPAPSQRKDPYGNMARQARRTALRGAQTFTRRNRSGGASIYRRRGRGDLEYIGVYKPSTRYKKQYWPFYERNAKLAARDFGGIWGAEWDRRMTRFR